MLKNFPVNFILQLCKLLDQLLNGDRGILGIQMFDRLLCDGDGDEQEKEGGSHSKLVKWYILN